VVSELKDNKVEEPNDLHVISSQNAFFQPQNNIVGSLPNDVRTYYSRLVSKELQFYRTAFVILY